MFRMRSLRLAKQWSVASWHEALPAKKESTLNALGGLVELRLELDSASSLNQVPASAHFANPDQSRDYTTR